MAETFGSVHDSPSSKGAHLEILVDYYFFFLYFLNRSEFSVRAMDTDILTIREVAEYLRITEKTAYRLASEGKLPGFKVGGSWRFRQGEIDDWIEEQKRVGSKDKN